MPTTASGKHEFTLSTHSCRSGFGKRPFNGAQLLLGLIVLRHQHSGMLSCCAKYRQANSWPSRQLFTFCAGLKTSGRFRLRHTLKQNQTNQSWRTRDYTTPPKTFLACLQSRLESTIHSCRENGGNYGCLKGKLRLYSALLSPRIFLQILILWVSDPQLLKLAKESKSCGRILPAWKISVCSVLGMRRR